MDAPVHLSTTGPDPFFTPFFTLPTPDPSRAGRYNGTMDCGADQRSGAPDSGREGTHVERAARDTAGGRAGGADGGAKEYVSFVVRLTRNDTGQVSGVVERVKTGEKVRFDGVDDVCRVIARMIGEEGGAG